MNEETIKYIGKIFIAIVILFSMILYFTVYDNNNNIENTPSQLKEVVTIETMTTHNKSKMELEMDGGSAFCKSHHHLPSANKLENSCSGLTKENCKSVSCCVLLNGEKCVAGGASGPTFRMETNGTKRSVDYYYYQNKCYGNKCPS
jgi:hypothetical protein